MTRHTEIPSRRRLLQKASGDVILLHGAEDAQRATDMFLSLPLGFCVGYDSIWVGENRSIRVEERRQFHLQAKKHTPTTT